MSDPVVTRSSLPVLIPLGQFAASPAIKLSRPVYVLGSKDRCRIHLKSSTVGSTHALLVQTRHLTYIRDLCSRTGVYVNGQQIRESVLKDGDLIAMGKFTFRYQGPKKIHGDEPPVAPAALKVVGAELPVPIERRAILIGRRPTADIPLLEPSVSTAHAVIFTWEGKRFLRDLWARTGTYLNGKPIHERQLKTGDVIRCGETDITYVPGLEEAAFRVIESAGDSTIAQVSRVEEIDLGLEIVPRVTPAVAAPLEVIIPPQAPPRQQELLPIEDAVVETTGHDTAHMSLSLEIEQPAPAQSEAVIDASAMAQASPVTSSEAPTDLAPDTSTTEKKSDLPRRGWRSAIQEADAEIARTQEPLEQIVEAEPATAPAVLETVAQAAPEIVAKAQSDIADVLGLAEPVRRPVVPQSPNVPTAPIPSTPPPEVIERTQPTPESALDLPVTEESHDEPSPVQADLTDTMFGRTVEEFEGEGLGPIIETPQHVEPPVESAVASESQPVVLNATVDASSVIAEESPSTLAEEPLAVDETPAPIEAPTATVEVQIEPAIKQIEPAIKPDAVIEAPQIQYVSTPIVELPAMQVVAPIDMTDLTNLRPEPLAPINEARSGRLPDVELLLALDDDENEPLELSPDETAMMAPGADAETASTPAPFEPPATELPPVVEAPPFLEPLPAADTTIASGASEGAATIDASTAIAEPDLTEFPSEADLITPEPIEESPVGENEPTIERDIGVAKLALDAAMPHVESPVDESEVQPATIEQNAVPAQAQVVETQPHVQAPAPADIEQSLDLSKLQPAEPAAPLDEKSPLDESVSMALLGDEPVADHSDSIDTTLTETPSSERSIDLSKLSPADDTIHATTDAIAPDAVAADSITADSITEVSIATDSSLDQPLSLSAEIASQPPVDDLSAGVADDPVDLSFLDNSNKPVDENTAVDVLTEEPTTIESTTIAGTAPDDGQAVIDHTVVDHTVVDHTVADRSDIETLAISDTVVSDTFVTDTMVSDTAATNTAAPDTVGSETLTAQTAMPFPDLLPPSADDAIVGEPPITEQTKPVEPPIGADAAMKIQPAPGIRPRRSRKSRVIRNAFGQDPNAPRPGMVEIPPFAADAPGLGASITLTGLSQPSVREADVFSEIPRSEIDQSASEAGSDAFTLPTAPQGDVFAQEVAKSMPRASLTGLADETAESTTPFGPQAKRARPRAMRPGMPMVGPRPTVAFADDEALKAAAERRRKLVRRAPILMGVMILLIGAAWTAAWFLVPVRTKIETSLSFRNFAALTQREQRLFQADQATRLNEEATRNTAVHKLRDLHPGATPGFLLDPQKYATMETFWPETAVGEFVIRYDSTSKDEDKARLEAVAMAMYDSNSQLADQTRTLKSQLENLRNLTRSNATKIKDLSTQIEHERELVDQAPTQDQIARLTATDKELDAKYTDTISRAKEAQADLDRLKKQVQQESVAAGVDPTVADGEIQKMTKDAEALSGRLAEARKSRAQLAEQARATLDSAYDEFKKQVDTAQDAAKENPKLAEFVNAAQNLQQAIREITDQYIEHQQQDYTALNEFKSKFEAKMTDRKATLLATDPKLKNLLEQKEIRTRKYNEAINSGLEREASDLANEIKLTDTAIKVQQELVSNDPVYNEMISGLQQLIDQKQRSINDERKKTDEKLAQLRQSFIKSTGSLDQMPADQKEVATAMRDRLAAIDAARKQYAEAADASAADADINIKRMNDDLQTLQTNIEARKKQLAAANAPELLKAASDERQVALAKKSAEVASLSRAMADARTADEQSHLNLSKAIAAFEQAKGASDRLEEAMRARDTVSAQKEQNDRELTLKESQAKRAVEPVEPSAADVRVVGDPIDNRAKIGLGASAGIFLFFAGWIMMTLRGAAKESHYVYAPPIEPLETPRTPKVEETEEEAAVA